ncbi:MAG: 4a-hydroxytetrahydrobiopterin dehydratase [Methanobacteriaceae archaeon]|nr:4a-hydroxytetrahydrobiopterin dehydratase [Methanobacteriaceae archaeon]
MTKLMLLNPEKIKEMASKLENWQVIDNHHLLGTFYFNDLAGSMHLAVKVGRLAEEMQHGPEMSIGAGKVELSIFTHDVSGLTDLDFEFAQRVEDLLKE